MNNFVGGVVHLFIMCCAFQFFFLSGCV